jgi:hypothetical protein
MSGKTILLIIFLLILFYILISYLVKSKQLSTLTNGQTMIKIDPSSLDGSSTTSPSNFTYSVWFYINDWNYRYGEPKVIFGRMGNISKPTQGSVDGINGLDPCPAVVLGAIENNIMVSLACFPGSSSETSTSSTTTIVHNCNISNVPIQKWVNLLISVYGRTLDIYIDGKLVKTCLLPGVANVNPNAPIYLTPQGGFSGWTSKLQYFNRATNPQEAWNIYVKGYGSSWLSNIFGQYKIKVSIIKNDAETTSVQV